MSRPKTKAMGIQKSDPAAAAEDYMQSDGAVSELGQNQLVSLQSKFRCKRDLYSYLDQKVSARRRRHHHRLPLVVDVSKIS